MNDLTLEDLVTKTADELIPVMTVDNNKEKIKSIKQLLKNYYKGGDLTELKAGNKILIDNQEILITKVLPSTNRVFLKFNEKEFSVSKEYLTNESPVFAFNVGDEVVLDNNEVGVVQKIVKSSLRVLVKLDSNAEIYFPSHKLQKLETN
jgi:hypothetical protein